MPVYKDRNGKYYFRVYVNKLGRSSQITRRGFSTRKDALCEMVLIGNRNESTLKNLTFLQLYENYMKYYESKNRTQSIRRIKSYFNNHILSYFKEAIVTKITTDDYLNWKEVILNKHLSDSFNKGLHGAVVTILNYAIKTYGLEKNVAKKMGGFKKTYNKKDKNVWTYEEYEKFIAVIDNIEDRALFITLYGTGMRFGELAALKWYDFDGSCLDVNKTISKECGKDNTHIVNDPKTRSSKRIITLGNDVIEALYELKKHSIKYEGFNENWFIFKGIKPYSHTTANMHKHRYCKLANVKEITLHEFRHSHVSLLISEGVPITDISYRVGHADPSITLSIYSHMLRKKKDPVLDVLNNLKNN